ncbi:Xaa-Pro peptidase family protein [Sporolactobacillus sp. Y61]|uniref:Xaa-Pro peptidase family protein n=1 Tax=Sporolactobacillus sp. Y61 TaxID=3160863 RepID=A0AAU8IE18_9BACL|nr:Xaa-Pro peptidase family protein [Sporolactobacillus sp. THM19-2]RYL94595.1 aminopeptidase P family protein [Sporolactobacillus sp. THM19-2]
MTNKIRKIEDWLKSHNGRFAYIAEPSNVYYLTHFKCDPHERFLGLFVFPDAEPFLICPALEEGQAKSSAFGHEVIGYRDDQDPWTFVSKAIHSRKAGSGKVYIEPRTLPYKKAEAVQSLFDASFGSIEGFLASMRRIKSPAELAAMKKAGEIADYAVKLGVNAIKKGRTETAIISDIEYELAKQGYSEMAFDTMVLTGENTAKPHGYPGNRQIKEGDMVLFDLGVVIDGYCSDITRTVGYKYVSDEQRKIYNTTLQANLAAIQAAHAGMRIGDLDGVARKVISDAGYGAYFTHRIGHGLGLGEHEEPSMSADNDNLLETGMVFTVEPGIYVPGVAGVRIEDDVYMSENGPETLTHYPKELQIIE